MTEEELDDLAESLRRMVLVQVDREFSERKIGLSSLPPFEIKLAKHAALKGIRDACTKILKEW
jgi:hypothetical protein